MKILVTGVKGQLGFDVVKELNSRGIENLGADFDDFDITDRESTLSFILKYQPDAVIHCAAYTAVDKAEDDAEICRKVNVDGTENIALACREINAKMLYISTDYVYGGMGKIPFLPTDETNPKSVYGQTKLDGEKAVIKHLKNFFVVRTSWVFGINGNNFVKTMLKLSENHTELRVVDDQIGSPTYTPDLARLICDLIMTESYGIYHGTNEGFCSWAEFATAIMQKWQRNCKIIPIQSCEYPAKAERPLNSRLSKACLDEVGIDRLPTWQDALDRYFKELK